MFIRLARRRLSGCAAGLPPLSHNSSINIKLASILAESEPVLSMPTDQVNAELRAIEADFRRHKMTEDSRAFVDNRLQGFNRLMVENVATGLPAIDDVAKYVLSGGSKLFRPRIFFYLLDCLRANGPEVECPPQGDVPPQWGDLATPGGRPPPHLHIPAYNQPQSPPGADPVANGPHLQLCVSYELTHTGSLMHDDVLDGSAIRRARQAPHLRFSIGHSILVGDLLLARAAAIVAGLGDVRLVTALADSLESLIMGELMTVHPGPTMHNDYMKKIYLKTAALVANLVASVAIMNNMGPGAHETLFHFGTHIGLAFQIRDDVLDYQSSQANIGKPVLNDINAGLLTLPVIMAASAPGSPGGQLLELLHRMGPTGAPSTTLSPTGANDALVGHILDLMSPHDWGDRCRLAVFYHLRAAAELLRGLGLCHIGPLMNYAVAVCDRA